MDRRNFVQLLATVTGGSAVIGTLLFANASHAKAPLTIQQVIDIILQDIPGAPFPNTVDTIKAGDASRVVTGIVTTMFATIPVIEKAAKAGANFIIAHEPTFYNHADDVSALESDRVYQYKKALLDKYGITVWRCHDYIHAHRPDGVLAGVLSALGWQSYSTKPYPGIVEIPPASLATIIAHCKKQLHIEHLRYIGNQNAVCKKIVLMPGAAGGKRQINMCTIEKPDLLIIGEASEWETPEYFRDAQAAGISTSLIVLGHIPSEQSGATWLAEWLKPRVKDISITAIDPGPSMNWG